MQQVNSFAIEIPNSRMKAYKIVTFIILTLNFIGFGYVFLQTKGTSSMIAIVGLLINVVPWLYYLLNKKHIKSPIIDIAIIGSSFIWLFFGNFWMGLMLLFVGFVGFFANKKPVILFSENGIEYPSFPTKKYTWAEVEQVIWKDDVLTIDLKNNKLLQFSIDKQFSNGFDVIGFNSWCAGLYEIK